MTKKKKWRVMFQTPGRVVIDGKLYQGFEWIEVDRITYEKLLANNRTIKACCGGKDAPFVLFSTVLEELEEEE